MFWVDSALFSRFNKKQPMLLIGVFLVGEVRRTMLFIVFFWWGKSEKRSYLLVFLVGKVRKRCYLSVYTVRHAVLQQRMPKVELEGPPVRMPRAASPGFGPRRL
eukprot:GEMP01089753.1.p1 GENE.GEMP01089753.1~~GEMP01089753.1.p1  ORF type:complete len:104 (+),score=4.53 GEMP01089753.1:65-376(+)